MAKGISVDPRLENDRVVGVGVDITEPETDVEIEIDDDRGVVYVHLEGYTVLRICRVRCVYVTKPRS